MTNGLPDAAADLAAVLDAIGDAAIAVSGGVDSTTLAIVAHRRHPRGVSVFHAVSPAVPPEATARVRGFAAAEGWRLRLIDAGEFRDPDYLANPADRCFHCKRDLYGTIRRAAGETILSGTNLDDLDDVRPGLKAAAQHGVRHPYIEARIGKAEVRALARALGLQALADLPAAPCLSSRIETGIPVRAETLAVVHAIERAAAQALGELGVTPQAVRCRVRRGGLVLEVDEASLGAIGPGGVTALRARIAAAAGAAAGPGDLRIEPYRRGSAFLRRVREGAGG